MMATTETAMICPACGSAAKRFGRHRNGLQRYRCLSCRKTFTQEHEPLQTFRVADYLNERRGLMAIQLLVEGCSVRTVERITGIRLESLLDLLVIAGQRCEKLMNSIRNVKASDVQCDEIWSFVGKKEGHKGPEQAYEDTIGDSYCWVAIEARTKLVLAYEAGRRTLTHAMNLMRKLRTATAEGRRFQLTTDGLNAYPTAVDEILADRVDFAQYVKVYVSPRESEARYSPPEFEKGYKVPISGNPSKYRISTSHVERQNLTMRMQIRRFTRLTNAFSKKLENHKAAIALHFAYYNFCRIHGTLRVTPAMEAGVADHIWTIKELLG